MRGSTSARAASWLANGSGASSGTYGDGAKPRAGDGAASGVDRGTSEADGGIREADGSIREAEGNTEWPGAALSSATNRT